MCWGGPFVLFVLAYIPNGFGLGLQGLPAEIPILPESGLTYRRPSQLPYSPTGQRTDQDVPHARNLRIWSYSLSPRIDRIR